MIFAINSGLLLTGFLIVQESDNITIKIFPVLCFAASYRFATIGEKSMKRILLVSALVFGLATPAAFAKSTLENVTEKGATIVITGYTLDISYAADGTYSTEVSGYPITGNWRIDGTKFCTTSSMNPTESCSEYPEGKGPGDTFTVQSETAGEVTVTIHE